MNSTKNVHSSGKHQSPVGSDDIFSDMRLPNHSDVEHIANEDPDEAPVKTEPATEPIETPDAPPSRAPGPEVVPNDDDCPIEGPCVF